MPGFSGQSGDADGHEGECLGQSLQVSEAEVEDDVAVAKGAATRACKPLNALQRARIRPAGVLTLGLSARTEGARGIDRFSTPSS
jgi:hypothetical protein